MRWRRLGFAACWVSACLPGCTSLTSEEMVPTHFNLARCRPATLKVERAPIAYSFRDPISRMGSIHQSRVELAVAQAVTTSGAFRLQEERADYRLQVAVFDVSAEALTRGRGLFNLPFDMVQQQQIIVSVAAHWRVLGEDGRLYYDDIVRTAFYQGLGMFVGKTDKRGAMRANIREGLRRIARVKLPRDPSEAEACNSPLVRIR